MRNCRYPMTKQEAHRSSRALFARSRFLRKTDGGRANLCPHTLSNTMLTSNVPLQSHRGELKKLEEKQRWLCCEALSADSKLQSSSPKRVKALPEVSNSDRSCLFCAPPN